MNGNPDDPALQALAAALVDGTPIDWEGVDLQSLPEEQRPILDDLRRVAAVAAAHRSSDVSDVTLQSAPGAHPARPWRHLLLFECVGTGAFGAVYRGWDSLVDRQVAIKLLPKNAGNRSPLEEGRTLARIRHPNVVVVYGADQDDDHVGIWMEYIDGQTLADIVRERGPMSAREASGIGLDLCRALSALHAAGVLHRDIKAQNVMREVGGRIVLMDFSGAEHVSRQGGTSISGTPVYMAPELFTGSPATVVSDIYSLGVLLFFLLSARFPVDGSTATDVEHAHAHRQRARLGEARPDVGHGIAQVIEQAVAHDPKARYQTVGELEHALAVAAGSHTTLSPPADNGALTRLLVWPLTGRAIPPVAAALVVLIGAAMFAGGATLMRSAPPASPAREVVFGLGPPFVSGSWPRVSPDGRTVVFGATVDGREQLWVRPLDSLAGRALDGISATETPFWSPDSRVIAFFADHKLLTVSVDGGDPQVLADAPHPRGGAWNAEGTLLFARAGGIHRVPAEGGEAAQVTALDVARGEWEHGWPEFLPDGRRFLYIIRSSKAEEGGLYLGSLDSAERRRIMPAYSRVAYEDGHLLFVREGTLLAQPFDLRAAALRGHPVPLAQRVSHHRSSDAAFDVAAGVLIYMPIRAQPLSQLVLSDRRGGNSRALTPVGTYRQPRFSPDGRRVVVERIDSEDGSSDLWIYDIERHSESRLTRSEAPDVMPVWSPDGAHVAFSSKPGTTYQILVKPVDSNEEERPLVTLDGNVLVESWSADGRYLSATRFRRGLWVIPLDQQEQPWAVRTDDAETWQSAFSPDNRWIAYTSAESGTPEVYVEPHPPTGQRWQVSAGGGAEPQWRGDAKELFYLSTQNALMAVAVNEGRWQESKPRRIRELAVANFATGDYSVTPDGNLIVANVFVSEPVLPPVNVRMNWTALLPRQP